MQRAQKALATVMLSGLSAAGCSRALEPQDFADQQPGFAPDRFFEGRAASWGVFETASGAPTGRFTTSSDGQRQADGSLLLRQHLTYDDGRQTDRVWRLRRTAPGLYQGSLSDGVGPVRGQAAGNAFHFTYTLALRPGTRLATVDVDQWMYGQPDGSMLNRLTVRKLGIVVAMVTEHFCRGPAARACSPDLHTGPAPVRP